MSARLLVESGHMSPHVPVCIPNGALGKAFGSTWDKWDCVPNGPDVVIRTRICDVHIVESFDWSVPAATPGHSPVPPGTLGPVPPGKDTRDIRDSPLPVVGPGIVSFQLQNHPLNDVHYCSISLKRTPS